MRIDNNSPVPPGAGHEIYKNQNVQPEKPVEKQHVEKSQSGTDRVEISAQGQQLLESQRAPLRLLMNVWTRGGAAVPAEESERIKKTMAFLSRTLVDAGVVDDFDKAGKIAEKVMKKVDETHGLNDDRLQDIRDKLKNNFYQSSQVVDTVAERLLDEMDLGSEVRQIA